MFSRKASLAALVGSAVLAAPVSADVHLTRTATGSAVIFNDNIGSGWRVNGRAPTDDYLISRGSAPTPFDETVSAHANRLGVDPRLVKSVMLVESNGNPRAISRKGARGLMQLMPQTAKRYGVKDSFDAVDNIRGGVSYLADLIGLFSGDVALVLAAYNAGEGAVGRYAGIPPFAETREYVRRALLIYRGGGGPATAPVLGGSFRGVATSFAALRKLPPAAPVQLQVKDGSLVMSNVGVVVGTKTPVLGRVEKVASIRPLDGISR